MWAIGSSAICDSIISLGMSKVFKVLTIAALLIPANALATPEYSRRTGKECNYCHPPNNFHLNEAGKYYKDHGKSLRGYMPSTGAAKAAPPATPPPKAPPAGK
jgi:hypothetical protein